jgi:hypothetical protein
MATFIKTPAGNLVNLSTGAVPVLKGKAVVFGTTIETFETEFAASTYYGRLLTQLTTATVSTNVVQDLAIAAGTITRIEPGAFDLANDTINVIGVGFIAAKIGKLRIEDEAGGLDNNGYYMDLTFRLLY